MRSCSDSIAQLAAALAKAQMELVNPAKTLTGLIDRWGTGNEGQTYRYAPLSAGLDIVRQALCKHELAVIQTTEVNEASGMVMLTTTLAHGPGEWISASWPVCRVADMANPKLMGAALTYARRYGLFTLVGIAGDDDLDAPGTLSDREDGTARITPTNDGDLGPAGPLHSLANDEEAAASRFTPEAFGYRSGAKVRRKRRSDAGRRRGATKRRFGQPADLILELAEIETAEALLQWTLGMLPVRNDLDDGSKERLDEAYLQRAQELGADPDLLAALSGSRRPPREGSRPGGL